MKRSILILCCASVMLLSGLNCAFAAIISGGAFGGWDADPFQAVSVSGTAATLQVQPWDFVNGGPSASDIVLSRHFSGVTSISFSIDFLNGGSRDVQPPAPGDTLPLNAFVAIFLPDSSSQINLVGVNATGVYDPNNFDLLGNYVALALPGSGPYTFTDNLGGIDGILWFDLIDNGDAFASQGIISDVSVGETATNPVPEPSTLLLLGGGLAAVLLFRSRRQPAGA